MTTPNKRTPTTLTVMFTAISATLLFFACDSTMITDPAAIEELHAEATERMNTGVKTVHPVSVSGGDGEPLLVIDGVIAENNSISELNPNNIESVSVLKGESAISAYKEKGKNGVILIKLKPDVEIETEVEVENEMIQP